MRSIPELLFGIAFSILIIATLPAYSQMPTVSSVNSALKSGCPSETVQQPLGVQPTPAKKARNVPISQIPQDLAWFIEYKKLRFYDRGARLGFPIRIRGNAKNVHLSLKGNEVPSDGRNLWQDVDKIVTGERETVTVMLKSGHELTVGPDTELKLDETYTFMDEAIKLFIDLKGKIRIVKKKVFTRKLPFAVQTTNAITGVRGTDFEIRGSGTGEYTFGLNEGKIDLVDLAKDKIVPIGVGQSINVPPADISTLANITTSCSGKNPSLTILDDPKVGGVKLHFEGLLNGDVTESELLDLYRTAQSFLKNSDRENLRVTPARKEALQVVSLDHIVNTKSETLGGLTRINGYVIRDDGKVFLVGSAESGKPPIETELLTVALRTIWKEGKYPFISLDPDPLQFEGHHKVRVGGMSEAVRDSAFTQIMIEADYRMKQVSLGALMPSLDGFRSYKDLSVSNHSGKQSISRFWLAPAPSLPGDILMTTNSGAEAVLYQTDVRVQTEKMKRVWALDLGFLNVGTDTEDGNAQAAAVMMNRFYGGLAATYPSFAKLRVIFEVAKLGAIWRARDVDAESIARLASQPVRRVEIAPHYKGITNQITSGTKTITLSGGATSKSSVGRNSVLKTERLSPLIDVTSTLDPAEGPVNIEIEFPATYSIEPETAKYFNADYLLREAYEDAMLLQYDRAIHQLNFSLDLDPELDEARAFRAVLNFILGDLKKAEADLNEIIPREPWFRAFRSVLYAYSGKLEYAIDDANFVEREYYSDESALKWITSARIISGDFERAERSINRLLNLAPLDTGARSLKERINFLYALGPIEAKKHIERLRAVPVRFYRQFALGMRAMQDWEFQQAKEYFNGCTEASRDYEFEGQAKEFYLHERCLIGQIYSLGALDLESKAVGPGSLKNNSKSAADQESILKAISLSDRIIALHPKWPTGYLLKAKAAASGNWDPDKILKIYDHAIFYRGGSDPLFSESRIELLGSSPLAFEGLALWYQLASRGTRESTDVSIEVLKRIMWLEDERSATIVFLKSLNLLNHMSLDDALPLMIGNIDTLNSDVEWSASETWSASLVGAMIANASYANDRNTDPLYLYLRATDREGLPVYLLRHISTGRLAVLPTLQTHYLKMFQGSGSIKSFRAQIANGDINIGDFHSGLEALISSSLEEPKIKGSPFISAYIEHLVRPALEKELTDFAGRELDAATGVRKEKLTQLVSDLNGKASLRELARLKIRSASGLRKEKLELLVIRLDRGDQFQNEDLIALSTSLFWSSLIESAESDVDLWTLKQVGLVLSKVGETVVKNDVMVADDQKAQLLFEYLGTAITQKRLATKVRHSNDWTTWFSEKNKVFTTPAERKNKTPIFGPSDGKAFIDKLSANLKSKDTAGVWMQISRESKLAIMREVAPRLLQLKGNAKAEAALRQRFQIPLKTPITEEVAGSFIFFSVITGRVQNYVSEDRVEDRLIIRIASKTGKDSFMVLFWQDDKWKLDLIESEVYENVIKSGAVR